MRCRPHVTSRAVFALALTFAACQRETEPQPQHLEPATRASAAPSTAPAAPASAAPSTRPPSAEQPFSGQDLSAGNWIETSAYKVRVSSVVRCADPDPSEQVPEDRPLRYGVKIDVFSKYDEFFLAPRDVSLENGGVIIDSERGKKSSGECSPLLEPKHLKHGQTESGVVLFQVPDEKFVRGGTVIFEPTRWGGAPRTQIKITKSIVGDAAAASPKTKP